MSCFLSPVNAFAASWATSVFHASWQGGLVIAFVWLICRLWPTLPPTPRGWLWRLVYAKLFLGLLWLPPLALPLLPKRPAPAPLARTAAPVKAARPVRFADAPPAPSPAKPVPFLAPPAMPLSQPPPKPRPTLPTTQTGLLAAWLMGFLIGLGRLAAAWRRAHVLYYTSTCLTDESLNADAAELSRQFGLRRVPSLRVADGLASPLLLGLGLPTILLPRLVLTDSPRSDLRLMLAHELAHLARRDLLWNSLPLLARLLFFFHPLVWLASHEWSLAQEIACDAQAVAVTDTPPADYGRMLLGIAVRRTSSASLFPTLAVAAPRHTLRRRLFAMRHIGTVSRPRVILAAALVAALAVGSLLPWRVVAQSGPPLNASLSADQKKHTLQDKGQADFDTINADADAQIAALLKRLPKTQSTTQSEVEFFTSKVARSQRLVQMLELSRTAYIASHPNRLSDAQIEDIFRLRSLILQAQNIEISIRWEQTTKVKLQAHLDVANNAHSRQAWQRQITASDQRSCLAQEQLRTLRSMIAHQEAKVAKLPEEQKARISMLNSYEIEIVTTRIDALAKKREEIAFLRRKLASQFTLRPQNANIASLVSSDLIHTSAPSSDASKTRTFQVTFRVPRNGIHHFRVIKEDDTGNQIVFDNICSAGQSVSLLLHTVGSKVSFRVYNDSKLIKNQLL